MHQNISQCLEIYVAILSNIGIYSTCGNIVTPRHTEHSPHAGCSYTRQPALFPQEKVNRNRNRTKKGKGNRHGNFKKITRGYE